MNRCKKTKKYYIFQNIIKLYLKLLFVLTYKNRVA